MYQSPGPTTALHRPVNDRMLAGVCAGLGHFFGIDPTLVRIGWVLMTLFGGSGVVAYLVAWLLIPDTTGRRAAAPLVLLLLMFAIPALCFLITLPFHLFF